MEEQIKKINALLGKLYMVFWILPILICALGETDVLPTGQYAGDVRVTYYMEVVGILLAASLVPVSLKMFHVILIKKIDNLSLPEALKRYRLISVGRLFLLTLVSVYNLLAYYMVLSTACILCACIALVASFLCIPGDHRLRSDLHILDNDNE